MNKNQYNPPNKPNIHIKLNKAGSHQPIQNYQSNRLNPNYPNQQNHVNHNNNNNQFNRGTPNLSNQLNQSNQSNQINRYEYANSDEDENVDKHQNALISSLIALANNDTGININEESRPTETRIEFVKNILHGCNMIKSMVDYDNCNTESAVSSKLNKKIIDVHSLLLSMNLKLRYLKSGTTGHTFKAVSKKNPNIAFAFKVCAYPKDDYGGMNNLKRPENAELRIIKLLSYFVVNKFSPHFVLPVGTFNTSITNFTRIPEHVIDLTDNKNRAYRKFIERYKKGEFESLVSVLISEWCNGGDLLDYIRNNYKEMTLKQWIVIFFQILVTLAKIQQKYPMFRHNDMKANNILVQLTEISELNGKRQYRYRFDDLFFIIPNIGLQIKIWDFDFACIGGLIENNKVNAEWTGRLNITNKKNQYYDIHYFFNTLINPSFFPQFYEGGVPDEIIEFVHRIIPPQLRTGTEYVSEKCRILVDYEYTTPYDIITTDPLFETFRFP